MYVSVNALMVFLTTLQAHAFTLSSVSKAFTYLLKLLI